MTNPCRVELTPAATRAVEMAAAAPADRSEAVRLLLALLAEPEGAAAVLVAQWGVDLAQLQPLLAEQPPHPAGPTLAQLAESARRIARSLSGETVAGSDDLVRAIVQEVPSVREVLLACGAMPEALTLAVPTVDTPLDVGGSVVVAVPRAESDTARILDATLNRVREALRVIEDYCRFALDDASLCAECKEIRHQLAAAQAYLGPARLLAARDTAGDVGTGVTATGEYERGSLADVVTANLKRLQEGLRTLEEYGKLVDARFAAAVEQLRYRSYTLERNLDRGRGARQRLAGVRLCVLLTGSQCQAALDWTIAEAAAGGVGMVQLREKELDDRALLQRARDVRRWTRQAGVLFIVNDRVDIAALAQADGVHLGQTDLPVADARRLLGPDALVGVSTHSVEQIRQAVADGADYLGVGPIFPSTTKRFDALAGLDLIRAASRLTSLPAFAIGGINPANVDRVVAAGASRVAVSAAIAQADDPQAVARALRAALAAAADSESEHA
jgi:thiamine-phosphate pyrophosphorylase